MADTIENILTNFRYLYPNPRSCLVVSLAYPSELLG